MFLKTHSDRLGAIRGTRYYCHIRLSFEQGRETGANNFLVINDD
jgi:hypothetical protein